MTRGSVRLLIAAVIAVWLISCGGKETPYTPEDRSNLNLWLDSSRTMPGEVISDVLGSGRSVVLVQDEVLRSDSIRLMRALVPTIRNAGVTELGVFFLNLGRQDEIDAYMGGENGEDTAVKLLLAADAALGYKEYCDFIVYVREFNALLPPEEAPLRLVALGDRGRVPPEGISSLLNPGKPGPVFLWITVADASSLPIPDGESGVPGPAVAVHHGPDQDTLRWGGLIESVAAERDIRDRSFGFPGDEAPFSLWNGDESGIPADIYLVTPFPYMSVTPIPDFITAGTAETALEFFPEISMKKPLSLAASRMNRQIRKAAKRFQREMNRLKMPDQS